MRGIICGALLAIVSLPAGGQEGVLPGERQPELPEFQEPKERLPELEVLLAPSPAPDPRLSGGMRARVESIVVEGSTVFTPDELHAVTAPFAGRVVGFNDLLQAAEAVTALYVDHGYITSGALVPDQRVENGIVRVRAIEGRLATIDVQGNRWFRASYFRDRLRRAADPPVNVFRLERALQEFQREPLVERIWARLEPTSVRGASRIEVEVREATPWSAELDVSNIRPPSIGQTGGDIESTLGNLVGLADELRFRFGVTEGLRDYDGSYSIPVTLSDTLLTVHARYSRGDVVLAEFDPLDIYSEVGSYGISLEQPLLRTTERELRIGVLAEYRQSRTYLGGSEFCTIPGAVDCRPRLAVLRFPVQWTWSGGHSALAARSMFSIGLDVLGATQNSGDVADGQFLSWLGQAQWAYRLPEKWFGSEIYVRLDMQIADRPLLPIEKFSVGGVRTVRGYRENELVRDNGIAGSLELRVPVYRDRARDLQVALAGFGDVGRAWDNHGPGELPSRTLASLGVGIRFAGRGWLDGYVYWGGRLVNAPRASVGPQRYGINFLVSINLLGLGNEARSWLRTLRGRGKDDRARRGD